MNFICLVLFSKKRGVEHSFFEGTCRTLTLSAIKDAICHSIYLLLLYNEFSHSFSVGSIYLDGFSNTKHCSILGTQNEYLII